MSEYSKARSNHIEDWKTFYPFIPQTLALARHLLVIQCLTSLSLQTNGADRLTTCQTQYTDIRVLTERSTKYREHAEGVSIPARGGKEFGDITPFTDGGKPRKDDCSVISSLIKSVSQNLPSNPRGCYLAFLDYNNK